MVSITDGALGGLVCDLCVCMIIAEETTSCPPTLLSPHLYTNYTIAPSIPCS